MRLDEQGSRREGKRRKWGRKNVEEKNSGGYMGFSAGHVTGKHVRWIERLGNKQLTRGHVLINKTICGSPGDVQTYWLGCGVQG